MRRSRPHHLENAVIALAILLAVVLGYFGIQRFSRGGGATAAPVMAPVSSPVKNTLVGSGTESAMSSLPPLKLRGVRSGHSSKTTAPPAPRSSSR